MARLAMLSTINKRSLGEELVQVSRVARGQYGPIPAKVVTLATVRRSRWALRIAGLIGRHFAVPLGLRRLSATEREDIAMAARTARFKPWVPVAVPVGFSLAGVDLVAYSKDVLTIRFADTAGRRFEVSQRGAWLPLEQELATAGVPFDRVPGARAAYLMHGKYGGEPIDLSFWSSRRALVFERGGLRIECREVVGRGPGLSALVRFASAALRQGQLTEVPEVSDERGCKNEQGRS